MKNQIPISILLKELRGSKTQAEMSKNLGYKFNQYFKWESGTNEISFEKFNEVCEQSDVQLIDILESLMHYPESQIDQRKLLNRLYEHWYSYGEEKFLKATKFSKSKWWRLKSGKAKLSLDDFLEIIEVIANKKDPFLKAISRNFRQKKHLQPVLTEEILLETFRSYPEFIEVYSCLFLTDFVKAKNYAARRNVILKKSGLEAHRLDRVLQKLKELNILDISKKELEEPFRFALSKANIDVHKILTNYCLRRHLTKSHIKEDGRTGTTSVIAAISEDAEKQILAQLTQCFHEIVKIISHDDASQKSRLAYIYLGSIR